MANINTQRKTAEYPQYILNQSVDPTFSILAVELLGYDSTNNVLRRVNVDSSGSISGDTLANYKLSDIADGDTSYFGFLRNDGAWYIMRLTSTAARYVAGSSSYDFSNRASLSYTTYDAAF